MDEDLRLEMDLDKFVGDEKAIQFRDSMNQVHYGFMHKRNFQKVYRAAAIILLFVTVGVVTWMIWPGNSNMDDLANRYFRSYQSLASVRSNDGSTDALMENAFQFYNLRNFTQAETSFRKLLQSKPNNTMARLYLGLSLMETGKTKEATPIFRLILQQNDVLYRAQSEWYLSLCLLKTSKKDEAISHLKVLAGKNGHYREMAEKLLVELK